MATITEPGTVKKILAHLGQPTEPLPRAGALDPTGQELRLRRGVGRPATDE